MHTCARISVRCREMGMPNAIICLHAGHVPPAEMLSIFIHMHASWALYPGLGLGSSLYQPRSQNGSQRSYFTWTSNWIVSSCSNCVHTCIRCRWCVSLATVLSLGCSSRLHVKDDHTTFGEVVSVTDSTTTRWIRIYTQVHVCSSTLHTALHSDVRVYHSIKWSLLVVILLHQQNSHLCDDKPTHHTVLPPSASSVYTCTVVHCLTNIQSYHHDDMWSYLGSYIVSDNCCCASRCTDIISESRELRHVRSDFGGIRKQTTEVVCKVRRMFVRKP